MQLVNRIAQKSDTFARYKILFRRHDSETHLDHILSDEQVSIRSLPFPLNFKSEGKRPRAWKYTLVNQQEDERRHQVLFPAVDAEFIRNVTSVSADDQWLLFLRKTCHVERSEILLKYASYASSILSWYGHSFENKMAYSLARLSHYHHLTDRCVAARTQFYFDEDHRVGSTLTGTWQPPKTRSPQGFVQHLSTTKKPTFTRWLNALFHCVKCPSRITQARFHYLAVRLLLSRQVRYQCWGKFRQILSYTTHKDRIQLTVYFIAQTEYVAARYIREHDYFLCLDFAAAACLPNLCLFDLNILSTDTVSIVRTYLQPHTPRTLAFLFS